jgi:peroxin-16
VEMLGARMDAHAPPADAAARGSWRWRAVLAIEAAKAACRLHMLRLTGGRRELWACVPPRDAAAEGQPAADAPAPRLARDGTSCGPRTGKQYLRTDVLLPAAGDARPPLAPSPQEHVLDRAVHASTHPLLLVRPLQGAELAAEVGHILRPLAYVLAMLRWGEGSWAAWLASAGLDAAALGTHALLPAAARSHGGMHPTALEAQEMRRRTWALGLYALRQPLYGAAVKGRLDAWLAWGLRRWVLSIPARILLDYQPLWEGRHFLKNP